MHCIVMLHHTPVQSDHFQCANETCGSCIAEGIMALLHHLSLDLTYASVGKTCCNNAWCLLHPCDKKVRLTCMLCIARIIKLLCALYNLTKVNTYGDDGYCNAVRFNRAIRCWIFSLHIYNMNLLI